MASHQEAVAEAQASAGCAVEDSTVVASEEATATTPDGHAVDAADPSTSVAPPTADAAATAPAAPAAPPTADPTASGEKPADTADARATAPAPLTRKQTEALEPATDEDITLPSSTSTGPALNINLMLTTGAKHPYKIDEKYLTNRGAKSSAKGGSGEFDPKSLTGYKLKELIWTDWRREWEPRPASPSSIRLITMGKMIDDKKTLNGEYRPAIALLAGRRGVGRAAMGC